MYKILIVDDSLIIRRTLQIKLEELGYEIVGQAKHGKEAITMFQTCKPDLVTMDITMPVMGGIMALKEIKKLDANAKVIMVTSHGEENLVMEAISKGARGYILKPINVDKLESSIVKALA